MHTLVLELLPAMLKENPPVCKAEAVPFFRHSNTREDVPKKILKMNQSSHLTRDMPRSTKNKINPRRNKPVPWRRTDEPRRLRYNRTMAMRAESNSPKAYVQQSNQRAWIWWKVESSQPLSVYECPAFEVLGWVLSPSCSSPLTTEVRWGWRRGALSGSACCSCSCGCGKDKDRAAEKRL